MNVFMSDEIMSLRFNDFLNDFSAAVCALHNYFYFIIYSFYAI